MTPVDKKIGSRTTRRPIEPTDLHRLRIVSDVVLHPAGAEAVCAVTWPDEPTDSNRTQLHRVDVDRGDRRQLTYGHQDAKPRFDRSGRRLAFVRSAPDQGWAVVILDWQTEELTEVARFEDPIVELRWAGECLLVLAPERPHHQRDVEGSELARRPRVIATSSYRFNGRGYTHDRRIQLFRVDPGPVAADKSRTTGETVGGTVRVTARATVAGPDQDTSGDPVEPLALGEPGFDHVAIAVSPDGARVAVAVDSDPDADLTGTNHVWVMAVHGDPATSPAIRLTTTGGRWNGLIWHHDGRLVAIGAVDLSKITFDRPHLIDTAPGSAGPSEPTPIGPHDVNASSSLYAAGNALVATAGGVMTPGFRRGRVVIDEYDLDTGELATIREADEQVLAFDATPDRSVILASISSIHRPAELFRLGPGDRTRLVGLNDDVLDELELAVTETVLVESTEGVVVEAFVTRPPTSVLDTDRPGPGLLYVHGGPMSQYGHGFFDEFQMAAATGYVVVAGNPRGSDGYGEGWASSIAGDLGNKDWDDVRTLTDHLCSLPEVDENRIGIGGGSYGGFMTGWALARDDRYKAGLIERAVTSWTTMIGTSDIGGWFSERTIGATIESDPQQVGRQSPLTYAADITAPTLILHSEHDWRCPIEQAEQLFAAIRRNGGRATFVRFPDENHELSRTGKPRHRVERFEIIHEFFAAHLGGADYGTSHLDPTYGPGPGRYD